MTIDMHKRSFKPLDRKLVDVNPEVTRRAAEMLDAKAARDEANGRIVDNAGRLTIATSFDVPYFKDTTGDQASEEAK